MNKSQLLATVAVAALFMMAATGLGAQQQAAAQLQKELLETADEVQKEVEALRGYEFKRPVQRAVMTKEELRDVLAEMMAKEFGGGKLERSEAWLETLGLMPGDRGLRETLTDVLLSQIGGFYDPAKKSFFMMVEVRMMIAHELCHALDDQYCDLDALMRPGRELSEDETYVVGGVVEGSATVLMSAWMALAIRNGADLGELGKMAEQQKDQMEVLLAAPTYCALLAANYMVGRHFITRGAGLADTDPDDTGAAINDVVKDMPRSTEQLLHPDKYWVEDQRDEPVLLDDEDDIAGRIARLTGKLVVHRDTLGEMVSALVASPARRRLNAALMARADYWTNRAARGWGGDRLFLIADQAVTEGVRVERPGVVWVTVWDSDKDRSEFVKAVERYRAAEPGFDVVTDGRVAVFAFGAARSLADAGLQAILEACSFQQDGLAWTR